MTKVTISAPPKPISPTKLNQTTESIADHIKNDLANYFNDLYKYNYFIWLRTGGYNSIIPVFTSNLNKKGNIGNLESTMLEYTLPSQSLSENGHYLLIEGFGTFASNSDNKRIRLYFGSAVLLDTGSIALNSGSWSIKAQVYRVSSNSQKVVVSASSSNSSLVYKTYYLSESQDLNKDIIIKFVSNGLADNDVIQEGLIVQNN